MQIERRPLFDGIRKREDGSFLSEREIIQEFFEDISTGPPEVLERWLSFPRNAIISLHMTVGTSVRNRFGLWDPDNPHVVLNPPPNAEGIIDHPNFPDQMSHRILVAVWDRLHADSPNLSPESPDDEDAGVPKLLRVSDNL